jgi:TolB protein
VERIIDADGKRAQMLTPPELEGGPPDVSPDGKQIIFYIHQDTPRDTSIYSLDVKTRQVKPLTGPEHMDTLPVFSPDSKQILFMSDRRSFPDFDTFIMNADGSNKRLLILGGSGTKWSTKVN